MTVTNLPFLEELTVPNAESYKSSVTFKQSNTRRLTRIERLIFDAGLRIRWIVGSVDHSASSVVSSGTGSGRRHGLRRVGAVTRPALN